MAQDAIRFVTPPGRIIWGSVSDRVTRDAQGNPWPAGTPDEDKPFSFGLAIRKDNPQFMEMLQKIYGQAVAGYPNNPTMAQRIAAEYQSGFLGTAFKFKIKDGDRPSARTGQVDQNAAGHWVLALSTNIPFKCGNTQNQEIDPKTIERGFFVDVSVSCKVNGNVDHTAGVYLNPVVVRMLAYGEKILGGISIDEAFAGHAAPTALPPGASAAPIAPAGGMPGLPGLPNTGQAPQAVMPGHVGGAVPGFPAQAPGFPAQAPGFPTPAAPQPGNPGSPTGYPINPATGQPFQPHTAFVAGPGMPAMPGS